MRQRAGLLWLSLLYLVYLASARLAAATEFSNPLPAVRADNWAAAEAAVQDYADPVARLVVTYLRLAAPGAARADEIAAFVADHPDWPNQELLEHRREEALANAPAGVGLLTQCTTRPLSLPAAQLRCADAWQLAGDSAAAAASARRAWVGTGISDPAAEQAFQLRWAGLISPADQWTRFQALAWAASPAASRQTGRLAAERRLAATARLAVQRNAPTAPVLLAALPAAEAAEPGLLLDRARMLRRAGHLAEASAMWNMRIDAAEAAEPDRAAAFWAERQALARALLRLGDPDGAYAIAAAHGSLTGEAAAEAEFLAGFIALRRLAAPELAAVHFGRLAALSGAITQARAGYWLGRAAAAAGADPRPAYQAAAAFSCTFYGQLAAQALGEDPGARLRALHDPAWSGAEALVLETHDLARAAALLIAWGEPRRANAFLLRLEETTVALPARSATAHLALAVGEPLVAVAIGRRIGRDGGMLPEAGWPQAAVASGQVDPAVVLGLIRQESSFDAGALSPAGARGLMQLMPATAQATARLLGEPVTLASLTADPAANIRLGTAYLHGLLQQFDGALPLAIAAYNAGPNRVQEWLTGNGDPRRATGSAAMIDWIELIPFNETRNYVQRVLENAVVYRSRRGEAGGPLLAGSRS